MKLTQKEAGQLNNILATCALGGIDSIVIQDKTIGIASGIQEGRCAIIVRGGVPSLPQKMGLTRLPLLKKRLDLLTGDALEIEAKESERGEIVQLEMKNGKTKAQFRCTSSIAIKAPASITDGKLAGFLTISSKELSMILNGIRAMGADQIILVVKQDGTAFFEMTDANDKFTVELEKPIERVDDDEEPDSAVFYYETGILSNLLRAAIGSSESISIAVGIYGMIQFDLNNCEMSIFAQIDGANA